MTLELLIIIGLAVLIPPAIYAGYLQGKIKGLEEASKILDKTLKDLS